MKRLLAAPLLVLAASVLLASTNSRPDTPDPTSGAARSFEKIKALAGTWVLREGDPGQAPHAVYRVTAGGSAVLETLFPGQHHEMLTVYHLDGSALRLTHYCMLGNQPRMKAKDPDGGDSITWEFAGGCNVDPAKDAHMHQARFAFDGTDGLRVEWDLFADGKVSETKAFDLSRRK